MLLHQTILLSLCLSISAHDMRRDWYGGHRGGSGSGSSGSEASVSSSNAATSSVENNSAATALSSAATSTTESNAAASTVTASGGSSTAASGSGNVLESSPNSGTTNQASSSGATLLAENIQPASDSDGGASVEAGQSPSATLVSLFLHINAADLDSDPDNFINFCSGKNTTDGFQVTSGSCNGVGVLV